MIQVTVFDRTLQAQFGTKLTATHEAAKVALDLSAAYPYVKVQNGSGEVLFTKAAGVSKERLVHCIETEAKVILGSH